MRKPPVLLVDDKPNLVRLLAAVLSDVARVVPAGCVREAIAALERERFAAVLCDLKLPDGDGLDVLRAVQQRASGTPFVLMTAYATVATAVAAMREGAFDYVTKPFDPEAILALVQRALAKSAVDADEALRLGPMIGRSAAMQEVFRKIRRVAPTNAPVLFIGESGVGKKLAARTTHAASERSSRALVAVDCRSIPADALSAELLGSTGRSSGGRAGAIDLANGSTLLVESIDRLPLDLQASLVQLLDRRRTKRPGDASGHAVDVRLLATTCVDLRGATASGTFREDLRLRLGVASIEIPPLRRRREDIALLASHFLADCAATRGTKATAFAADVLERLEAHTWPQNVTELRAIVERAAIDEPGGTIRIADLPLEVQGAAARPPPDDDAIGQMAMADALELIRTEGNRRYLEIVMRRFRGDVAAAADHAGIERESFYRLLRRYGISPSGFRERS